MPDSTNPYLTVNAPSYAAPMLDWQKMAQGISGGLTRQPQQVNRPPITPPQGAPGGQLGQPGQPQPNQAQPQPNQAQQQMQGLGARLQAMFGGQQGVQPGQPMGQPQMPGMAGGGGPQGWTGGWNVNG